MLPQLGDSPESQAKSSLEGKLDCMGLNGYGTTARENVELNRYLNTPLLSFLTAVNAVAFCALSPQHCASALSSALSCNQVLCCLVGWGMFLQPLFRVFVK